MTKKILIVDDEVKILEVVKALLKSKGFDVLTAETGKRALEIFEKEEVALILLDLMLPEISGEEVCRTIRKKSLVPIIMLTAKADEADLLEGLGIGADDYITKPFSLKELYARIEAVIRRVSSDAPLFNKVSFGDLEINFSSYKVTIKGEEIKLTPNEYKLLAALAKNPNKVFTRDQLIYLAFDNDFEGYDRAVDSHIKNLRQKLKDDPKNPKYIVTVHGIGYKFGGDGY